MSAKKLLQEVLYLVKDREIMEVDVKKGDQSIRLVFSSPTLSMSHLPIRGEKEEKKESKNFSQLPSVVAQMVGVVYLAPSPDKPPYVKVGQRVQSKDVVCIIEAMKIMNHVCAGVDGVVKEICVQNEEVVQFNQVLFIIEPC